MWQMHGLSGEEAQKATVAVYRFETKLARSMMTQVELRNIEAQYNVFSAAARGAAYKNMLWKVYCKGVGLSGKERTVITQPKYFELLDSILAKGVTAELKRYLAWCVLSSATSYTSDKAHKRAFDFYGTTLTGLERRSPLWKRSAGVVEGVLGYALGQIYVKKHFSESAKKKVKRMVEHLIAVYEKRIKDLDWMSASTKKKAIVKLHSFEALIGYPDKWRSYKGLVINPEKSYYDNLSAVATYEHRRNIKRLGKKVERKEWHMTPQTVNAYCSLDRNLIVFPAAILQPPCFDTSQDDAVNYGAIGAVIGHEMTHGYDDMGRQFDQKGNLKNWWQEKDRTQFMKKAQMLVTQFNELALHGQQVNGELTLGENIADLGGATLAYDALMETLSEKQKKAKKDGLTPQQRFFVGWARAWREVARPEFTKRQLLTDPHAPEKFRTNIPFANMTEFHEAYGVTEGDKMWLPENKRAKIW
jgi:putative endopeptidase